MKTVFVFLLQHICISVYVYMVMYEYVFVFVLYFRTRRSVST